MTAGRPLLLLQEVRSALRCLVGAGRRGGAASGSTQRPLRLLQAAEVPTGGGRAMGGGGGLAWT